MVFSNSYADATSYWTNGTTSFSYSLAYIRYTVPPQGGGEYLVSFDYATSSTGGTCSNPDNCTAEVSVFGGTLSNNTGGFGPYYGSGHVQEVVTIWNGSIEFYAGTWAYPDPGDDSTQNATISNISVQSVPIPGALILFGPGLAGVAAVRRRFKK